MLPQEYIVQKFYTYCGGVKYNKYTNTYQGSCPICREGSSWLKKRRCYFIVDKNAICCHNCGWYGTPIRWVCEAGNLTRDEVLREIKNYTILPQDVTTTEITRANTSNEETLPHDCINLFDQNQIDYYSNNKIVTRTLELIKRRRINTAINRPDTLWLSLSDKVHKNRLVIPFYNENGDITFYQTRTVLQQPFDKLPKYLSKVNGAKSLYNLNKITADLEYIFIFEGPIDSFFVKNGTAVAGIQEKSDNMFAGIQQAQIDQFKFHKRIWVLDSQWQDNASKTKTKKLIDNGETVFIWPEKLGKQFKDINDVCITGKIDQISPQFFINHSYNGLKAKLLLSTIV